MRRLTWTILSALLAVLLLAAAACGGGDKKDGAGVSNQDGSGSGGGAISDLLVANPGEALGASVASFSEGVESMQGTFVFSIAGGGFEADMNGEFAYQAPDAAHMKLVFEAAGDEAVAILDGLSMEVIVRGDEFYLNSPFFEGWVVMSAEELGADAEAYQQLVVNHAPFDYSALVDELDGVEYVGEQEIDGVTYVKVSVETDFAALMAAVSDAFSSSGLDTGLPVDSLSGPVRIDIWLDADSGLPRRLAASGTMELPEGEGGVALAAPMEFEMRFDIEKYNGDVEVPEAPADARSFLEMITEGGLFGEE